MSPKTSKSRNSTGSKAKAKKPTPETTESEAVIQIIEVDVTPTTSEASIPVTIDPVPTEPVPTESKATTKTTRKKATPKSAKAEVEVAHTTESPVVEAIPLEPTPIKAESPVPTVESEPIQIDTLVSVTTETESQLSLSVTLATETEKDLRKHPIPPPTEAKQYRAVGLVKARYIPSAEQYTQGKLITSTGIEIDSVLLGRIMSLVKNHLDLNQEHLWVVYPRTRQENGFLHVQIMGVWEPETLKKNLESNLFDEDGDRWPPLKDGYFSIRGEVIFQSPDDPRYLIVKIKQAPRKPTDKPKFFKLKLVGALADKAVGRFWDFQVELQDNAMLIQEANDMGFLKKRSAGGKFAARPGGKRPFTPREGGYRPRSDDQGGTSEKPEKPYKGGDRSTYKEREERPAYKERDKESFPKPTKRINLPSENKE